MKERSIKRKLLRTRIALGQTVDRILDINRRRKHLVLLSNREEREEKLNEELRVLNQIANQQAQMVRKYETDLSLQRI